MDKELQKSVNFDFIEEYKRLDNLLSDAYSVDKGITNYIDIMKNTSVLIYQKIPDWESDLKNLKHYRHIRNKFMHDIGTTLDQEECDEKDIIWLKNFYQKIMQGTDPLSELRRHEQRKSKPVSNNVEEMYLIYSDKNNDDKFEQSNTIAEIIFVVLVIVVALIFIGLAIEILL